MVKISGGDGSSLENASIISDCNNTEGVRQEYLLIEKTFANFKLVRQELLDKNNRKYDKFELEINGEKVELFFDITEFFGKY